MWWMVGTGWADEPTSAEPWGELVAPPPVARPPVPEEWSDGLTRRPLRSPGVEANGVAAFGGSAEPMFGVFSAGYGATVERDLALGIGVDAQLVKVDGPTSQAIELQTLGLEGWVVAELDNTRHGFALGYYEPIDRSGWYLYHPSESGRRLLLTYDGYVDLGRWFDLSYDLKGGLADAYAVQLSGAMAAILELDRHVALSLGFQAAFAPTAVTVLGVDVRPVDHLELSGSVGVPVWVFEERRTDEVQPGVRVKAWF